MKTRIFKQFQGFLNTPSLFLNSYDSGLLFFNKNLQIGSNNLESIEFSKNTVLGKRVEQFFIKAIEADNNLKMIANNIQIQSEDRTLGELDFILRDLKEDKILHVELMYKFYVYDPEIPQEMERWIGPNRKDSLLQKIEKVKTNQLPILHRPETKAFLNLININSDEIQQEVCFKATLFIPKEFKSYNFPNINKSCIAGFWIHLKNLSEYNKKNYQFFAPEKQDWPIDPKENEEWVNFKKVSEEIRNLHSRKKSPLIWIKKKDGSFERIIVVWW